MIVDHATPELFAALAAAQAQAKTVEKAGRNTDQNYNYATADDMIAAGRAARAGTGLSLVTTWVADEPEEFEKGGDYGRQWVCAIVRLHWVLTHESGGYIRGSVTAPAIASRGRTPEKAQAAAATYAEGFLERGLMRLDRATDSPDDVDRRRAPAPEPAGVPDEVVAGLVEGYKAAQTVEDHKLVTGQLRTVWADLHPSEQESLTEHKTAAAARIKALMEHATSEEPEPAEWVTALTAAQSAAQWLGILRAHAVDVRTAIHRDGGVLRSLYEQASVLGVDPADVDDALDPEGKLAEQS